MAKKKGNQFFVSKEQSYIGIISTTKNLAKNPNRFRCLIEICSRQGEVLKAMGWQTGFNPGERRTYKIFVARIIWVAIAVFRLDLIGQIISLYYIKNQNAKCA